MEPFFTYIYFITIVFLFLNYFFSMRLTLTFVHLMLQLYSLSTHWKITLQECAGSRCAINGPSHSQYIYNNIPIRFISNFRWFNTLRTICFVSSSCFFLLHHIPFLFFSPHHSFIIFPTTIFFDIKKWSLKRNCDNTF